MATPRSTRNPLFLGRWFDDEIILLCVRWYVSYKLSYRDQCERMADRGLEVSHTTLMHWVVHYAPAFEKRWRAYGRPIGGSWRVYGSFVKVCAGWKYLYGAVDQRGRTVNFFSATRGFADHSFGRSQCAIAHQGRVGAAEGSAACLICAQMTAAFQAGAGSPLTPGCSPSRTGGSGVLACSPRTAATAR